MIPEGPARAENEEKSYIFEGWKHTVTGEMLAADTKATADATYQAIYQEVDKKPEQPADQVLFATGFSDYEFAEGVTAVPLKINATNPAVNEWSKTTAEAAEQLLAMCEEEVVEGNKNQIMHLYADNRSKRTGQDSLRVERVIDITDLDKLTISYRYKGDGATGRVVYPEDMENSNSTRQVLYLGNTPEWTDVRLELSIGAEAITVVPYVNGEKGEEATLNTPANSLMNLTFTTGPINAGTTNGVYYDDIKVFVDNTP